MKEQNKIFSQKIQQMHSFKMVCMIMDLAALLALNLTLKSFFSFTLLVDVFLFHFAFLHNKF